MLTQFDVHHGSCVIYDKGAKTVNYRIVVARRARTRYKPDLVAQQFVEPRV